MSARGRPSGVLDAGMPILPALPIGRDAPVGVEETDRPIGEPGHDPAGRSDHRRPGQDERAGRPSADRARARSTRAARPCGANPNTLKSQQNCSAASASPGPAAFARCGDSAIGACTSCGATPNRSIGGAQHAHGRTSPARSSIRQDPRRDDCRRQYRLHSGGCWVPAVLTWRWRVSPEPRLRGIGPGSGRDRPRTTGGDAGTVKREE